MKTSGRPWAVRLQNAGIALGARRHHFDGRAAIPFLCECDDADCVAYVGVPLPEYDRLRDQCLHVVALGHSIDGGRKVGGADGYLAVAVA